jgi:hypothetical protein
MRALGRLCADSHLARLGFVPVLAGWEYAVFEGPVEAVSQASRVVAHISARPFEAARWGSPLLVRVGTGTSWAAADAASVLYADKGASAAAGAGARR